MHKQYINFWSTDGEDYNIKKVYTIFPQENNVTINVDIINDDIVEGIEYFVVSIDTQTIVGALVRQAEGFTQVQIHDQDSKCLCMYVWNLPQCGLLIIILSVNSCIIILCIVHVVQMFGSNPG